MFGCPPQKEKKGKVLLKGGLSAVCCGKEQEENQAPFSAVRSGPNEGKGGAAGKEERPGTISPVASCCGEEEKPKGAASCRLENGKEGGAAV